MIARYHDPAYGRFSQADYWEPTWVGLVGPHALTPQEFVYVANNPLNFTDPGGHGHQCRRPYDRSSFKPCELGPQPRSTIGLGRWIAGAVLMGAAEVVEVSAAVAIYRSPAALPVKVLQFEVAEVAVAPIKTAAFCLWGAIPACKKR